jgi:tripartite-type tricarboxylate transporter receptor subunit TctC
VKVIVPFPAGGVTDIATRLIAQKLSERLGQQFYIENIGGAGVKRVIEVGKIDRI